MDGAICFSGEFEVFVSDSESKKENENIRK